MTPNSSSQPEVTNTPSSMNLNMIDHIKDNDTGVGVGGGRKDNVAATPCDHFLPSGSPLPAEPLNDQSSMSSSMHMIKEPQARMAIEKLKPVSDDLMNRLCNESQASVFSELSLCVNDSASGKSFDVVYESGDVLGEGGFAVVKRCRHIHNGRYYAVKEVRNEDYESTAENIKEEIDALKKLRDGPYIVRLFDVFQGLDKTHLILEEMKGTDLLERLGEREVFPEPESRRMSRRLLEAVRFCHKKKICHRDIKLENILVAGVTDDTKIKLGDFGCSHRITGPYCLKTLCGSPQYVAPEVYIHENGYDERCDLWSVGVCIYVFLGGYAPFEGSAYELPEMICDGHYDFHPPYWTDISTPPKDLVRRLLVVNPEDRASVEEALDSDWLRRRDKECMLKFMEATKGNVSSTNTFDAWVRLQNESQHSAMSMDSSYGSTKSQSFHTAGDDIMHELYTETKCRIPDSIRSLQIEEL
jgi:serine/threonine protein kinase